MMDLGVDYGCEYVASFLAPLISFGEVMISADCDLEGRVKLANDVTYKRYLSFLVRVYHADSDQVSQNEADYAEA